MKLFKENSAINMGIDSFIPRFTKCCFCLSLRTGSLVIGYVSTVLSLLILTFVSLSLYKVVEYVDDHKNNTTDSGHTPEELRGIAISLYITHAYFLLIFLYNIIISILLIVGIHKTNANFINDYFKAGLFLLFLSFANVIMATVFMHFAVTLAMLKWSVIIFYNVAVIRSYFLEVEEARKNPTIEMQNLYNPPRYPSHLYA